MKPSKRNLENQRRKAEKLQGKPTQSKYGAKVAKWRGAAEPKAAYDDSGKRIVGE